MRVTNNMITRNTKSNVNSNKVLVDRYNTQMTTQKKISKASDNPVIAIRSLRLSTSLSHLNQYVDNNIPDAESWLDVTETALKNMEKLLTDVRTLCVNGSTDTLTSDDRKTILQQLTALADQVYTEGNADYAGRTVFTGYRTSSQLTFETNEPETKYVINQSFTNDDLKECRYYFGDVTVPTDANTTCATNFSQETYYRIRLAYDGIDSVDTGAPTYDTLKDWEADLANWEATADAQDGYVFIRETGELIFTKTAAEQFLADESRTLSLSYEKTGFDVGEVRPEYYYDCTDVTLGTTPDLAVEYTKEDQDIDYTIANSTTLTVNTQASEVFSTDIKRDVHEMIDAVQWAINAHDKVDKIKGMMKEVRFQDPASQEVLQGYLDQAEKEADYYDDNLQKLYGQYISNFDGYLEKVNNSITNVGSMTDRLTLIRTRVENQETTIEELKSSNEDRDISDIIIDYYAAYNAYQASLTAASKVGSSSLLDYI